MACIPSLTNVAAQYYSNYVGSRHCFSRFYKPEKFSQDFKSRYWEFDECRTLLVLNTLLPITHFHNFFYRNVPTCKIKMLIARLMDRFCHYVFQVSLDSLPLLKRLYAWKKIANHWMKKKEFWLNWSIFEVILTTKLVANSLCFISHFYSFLD